MTKRVYGAKRFGTTGINHDNDFAVMTAI